MLTTVRFNDLAAVNCGIDVPFPPLPTTTTTATTTPAASSASGSTTTTTTFTGTVSSVATGLFSCPLSAGHVGFFGISASTGILTLVYGDGIGSWTTTSISSLATSTTISLSTASLDGLAYAAGTSVVYFASFSGVTSPLYAFDLSSNSLRSVGQLQFLATNGAILRGEYYYVPFRSNTLRKVVFDTLGNIYNESTVGQLGDGARFLDVGDIDFDVQGENVYVAAEVKSSNRKSARTISRELGMFNLASRSYTYLANLTVSSQLDEVGVGADGRVYNDNKLASAFSQMTVGSNSVSFGRTLRFVAFADMASVRCA